MEKSICLREYAIVLRLLKEAREQASSKQLALAGQLQMSQTLVTKIERGIGG